MEDFYKKYIEELKELCNKATQGPWKVVDNVYVQYESHNYDHPNYKYWAHLPYKYEKTLDTAVFTPGDARFIAEARTAIPFLIELVERQAEEIEKLKEVLSKYRGNKEWCAICYQIERESK